MNRLEGFPETYDAGALHATLERALRSMVKPITTAPTISATASGIPVYNQAKTLGLTLPYEGGTYGAANDPRVARASLVESAEMSGQELLQRFRLKPGVSLVPLCIAPMGHAASAPRHVFFGRFVLGIPHRLGRIPEFIVARSSASDRGPVSQVVSIIGGTANTLATNYANNEPVRCNIDFIPILGITRDDILRQLYPLFQFWNGAANVGEFTLATSGAAPAAPAVRYFETANLAEAISSEMVTTDKMFCGLLMATNWGFGTFQGNQSIWAGAVFTNTDSTPLLVDAIQGHDEPMVSCILPCSRSAYAMKINNWQATITLQDIYNNGIRLLLTEGSVDFVMR